MKFYFAVTLCVSLTSLAFNSFSVAESAEARERLNEVVAAYRDIQTFNAQYTVTVGMRPEAEAPFDADATGNSGSFGLAVDKENDRMAITAGEEADEADFRFVAKEGTFYLRFSQVTNRHVEIEGQSMDYDALLAELPWLNLAAELPFLIAEDPVEYLLTEGTTVRLTTGEGPTSLVFQGSEGTMILQLDPASKLISSVRMADRQANGEWQVLQLAKTSSSLNEPLPNEIFAFDAEGSEAVGSMAALIEQGPHPLVGQPAPAVTLKTIEGDDFSLEQSEADVVILDFWASWCGPCIQALPLIDNVNDWIKQEGKKAAIYTINLRETPALARPVWDRLELDLPILMDTDGAVANSFGVTGIPHTVILANGQIAAVHVGFSPDLERTLKADIERLLAE